MRDSFGGDLGVAGNAALDKSTLRPNVVGSDLTWTFAGSTSAARRAGFTAVTFEGNMWTLGGVADPDRAR